jgi:hypothetical protein
MTHLTHDELVDALDEGLSRDRQAHLESCARCRDERDALLQLLARTQQPDVPEPSPLFWDQFSSRVRQSIDTEMPAAGWWHGWLRWPVLAPIATLGLLLVALGSAVSRGPADLQTPPAGPVMTSLAAPPIPEVADAPEADADPVDVLAELVGPLDWDTASEAGLAIGPGAADLAVFELNMDEQRELHRLLTAELSRPKS